MKFGFNFSSQWFDYPFIYSMNKAMKILSKVGMDYMEVQLAVAKIMDINGHINKKTEERFTRLTKKYKIKIGSVHAPYPEFTPTYLDSMKGNLHKKTMRILKNTLKVAHRMKAKVVVIHPSHTLGYYKDEEKYRKKILKKMVDNLQELINFKEESGYDVKIAIETMSPKPDRVVIGDTPGEILKIVKELKNKVGICWDMCHTYKSMKDVGYGISKFKPIAKKTIHIHYSSFSPIFNQCHSPTKYGKEKSIYHMVEMLKKYKGLVICEISPLMLIYFNPKKSLEEWLTEILCEARKTFKKKCKH